MTAPVLPTPSATAEAPPRTPGAAAGLLGLALLTATTVIFGGLIVVMFPEELGFISVPLLIIGAVTLLSWRLDATWPRVVAVLATLGLGAMMFWAAFGLAHPSSFFDFVPAVLFVLGVVLSLGGNGTAIVRRNSPRATPGREHRIQQVAVGIVLLAVAVSGTLAVFGRDAIDPSTAPDATPVGMGDFAFEPTAIEARAGGQLLIHNGDAFVHDFTVPALDLAVTVNPGSSDLLDVPAAPGTYVAYCTLHSDPGDPDPDPEEAMVARLTVR
jgi:plastocyanin